MFVNIDKNIILNIFGVDTFYGLEKVLDNMSPSLVEYHLSNFLDSDNSSYFDKKNQLIKNKQTKNKIQEIKNKIL